MFGGCIVALSALRSPDWLGVVMALIVVVLGLLLIRARPYRPDLGDSRFSERRKD